MFEAPHDDSPEAIARDIAAIGRISAVPTLLRIICSNTGMGFAAVARVTDGTWTACAVQDDIGFGLQPGGQLPIETTLCRESRQARQPVVIDHASSDPAYRAHHTPRIYNIESYISVPIVHSNGDYFGNLCAIDPRPAKVSDPRILTMFTLFADLVARQLESEDQRIAAESALSTERATAELREQFIAVLGHDLRNPLAAVSMTANTLARRTDQPELAKTGWRLLAASRRMGRLIDDVLDFARGRLGSAMGVSLSEADDLTTALRDVVAESREGYPSRTIEDAIAIPRPVRCDRGRIQQLLSNLLGNAITYGAVDRAIVVEGYIDGDEVVLIVANSGDPIPPESLDKVFQPYWRPATSKPGGGLGLGLYICTEIVKAHGGSLQVSSTAATGTRFTARLPIAAA